MYKVGYIDDEKTQFKNFSKKIKRYDDELELCWIEGSKSIPDITDNILREKADVLLIDYKMAKTFGFNGAKLVSQINDYIADLSCYILTQVDKNEINDGLVETRNILSKSIFDTEALEPDRIEQLKKILNTIKESAKVFRARMDDKVSEYRALLEEKKRGELKEENVLIKLYQVLSSYGYVEKLPEEMLSSNVQSELKQLIDIGQRIIEKHEGSIK